jgi:hypothetical protein
MIPIGFYRPDLAETNNGVSLAVLNAILMRDELGAAYGPHPSIGTLSTAVALPSAPKGITSVVTRAGGYQAYAGTADKLFKIAADGTYTEIGSGYGVPSGDQWSMAQFGDYIYFTNTFDGLLRYNIESGGTVDAVAGAPKGRIIFPLFNTLAMLDCDGDNKLMKTSAINNPTIWSGDASNRYQYFADGEELIGGGELSQGLAVVFQRNAIRVLTRTRDRSIFIADQLALGIGAQSPQSVVIVRGWAYFVDTDGFHRTNGQGTEPIGKSKVSKTFINSLAASALVSVQGAYDPENNRILYRYLKSTALDSDICEDVLAYHIDEAEWVPIEMDTAALITMSSPGYTLDELDQFGTIDTLPYPLDSRAWKGGEPRLAAVDGDLKFGFVSGASLACTLETGALLGSARELVNSIRPVTDSDTATIQIGVKEKVSDDFTWKTAQTIQPSGQSPVRGSGRIKSFRANIAAGATWTFFRGFDNPQGASVGMR